MCKSIHALRDACNLWKRWTDCASIILDFEMNERAGVSEILTFFRCHVEDKEVIPFPAIRPRNLWALHQSPELQTFPQ